MGDSRPDIVEDTIVLPGPVSNKTPGCFLEFAPVTADRRHGFVEHRTEASLFLDVPPDPALFGDSGFVRGIQWVGSSRFLDFGATNSLKITFVRSQQDLGAASLPLAFVFMKLTLFVPAILALAVLCGLMAVARCGAPKPAASSLGSELPGPRGGEPTIADPSTVGSSWSRVAVAGSDDAQALDTVHGIVIDAVSRVPVNAVLQSGSSPACWHSDSDRGFRVQRSDLEASDGVTVHSLGYQSTAISVDQVCAGIIQLQPAYMCEVTVVDADGLPVSGAELRTCGSPFDVLLGASDDRGRATIAVGASTWAYASLGTIASDPVELSGGVDRRIALRWSEVCRLRVVGEVEPGEPLSLALRRLDQPGSPERECERVGPDGYVFGLTPGAYELHLRDEGWAFETADLVPWPIDGKRLGASFRHFTVTEADLGMDIAVSLTGARYLALHLVLPEGHDVYSGQVELVTEFEVPHFGHGWTSARVITGSLHQQSHRFYGLDRGELEAAERICIRSPGHSDLYFDPQALLQQVDGSAPIELVSPQMRTLEFESPTAPAVLVYDGARDCSSHYELRRIPIDERTGLGLQFEWRGGDVFVFPGGIQSVVQRPSPMAQIPHGGLRIPASDLASRLSIAIQAPAAGVIRVLDVPPTVFIGCQNAESGHVLEAPDRERDEVVFAGLPPGVYHVYPLEIGRQFGDFGSVGAVARIEARVPTTGECTISWPRAWKELAEDEILVRTEGIEPQDVWVAPFYGSLERQLSLARLGPWRRCNANGACSLVGIRVQPSHLVMGWQPPVGTMIPLGISSYSPIVECRAFPLALRVRGGDREAVAVNLDTVLDGARVTTNVLAVPANGELLLYVSASGVTVDFVGLTEQLSRIEPDRSLKRVEVVGDFTEGSVFVR